MNQPQTNLDIEPQIPDHELDAVIGRGSYGEVWRATNVMGMGRAVKIVRREQFDSDKPFEREYAALQRYEVVSRAAEGLVAVLHIGRSDGQLYYVMELADARNEVAVYEPETLKSKLEQGFLPAEEVLVLGTRLTHALGMLHEHGLVHRDVKPANIIFVRGQAKLADIGLVAQMQPEAGSMLGTEGYVPPEGQGSSAADLFSLGIVLWQALTGGAVAVFPKIEAKWLTQASPMAMELLDVTLKAAESNATSRYLTANELLADLTLIQSGQSARALRGLSLRVRWLRRMAWVAAFATVGLVVQRFHHKAEMAQLAKQSADQQILNQQWHNSLLEAVSLRRSGIAGERHRAETLFKAAAVAMPLNADEKLRLRDELAGVWNQADLVLDGRWAPGGLVDVLSPTGGLKAEITTEGVRLVNLNSAEPTVLAASGRTIADLGGFDPTGRYLVGIPSDGGCVVWEIATGRLRLNWPGPPSCVWAFSPDGTAFLHSAFAAGVIRTVDLRLDPKPDAVDAFFGNLLTLAPSPDGLWLALGVLNTQGQKEIVLWNRTEQKVARTVVRAPHKATSMEADPTVAWSPDSRQLVLSLGNREIGMHQREVSEDLPRQLQGHGGAVVGLLWSPDGQYIASTDWSGTTRIWLAATGQEQVLLPESSLALDWRSDASGILLRQSSGPVSMRLTPPVVSTYATGSPPHGVSFSPNEKWLAADGRHSICILNLDTHAEIGRLHAPDVMTPHWALDGASIYAISAAAVYRWPVTEGPAPNFGEKSTVHAPGGSHLVASADGQTLAWVSPANTLVLAIGGAAPQTLSSAGASDRPAISPSGHWLTLTHWHGSRYFRYQDLKSQTLYRIAQPAFFNQPESSGTLLANDAQTGLQRWIPGNPQPTLLMPPDQPHAGRASVAVSGDGKWIAAQCANNRIALIAAATGQVVIRLEIPGPFYASGPLTLSQHGSYLAANSWHGFVHVWDLRELRRRLAELNLDAG